MPGFSSPWRLRAGGVFCVGVAERERVITGGRHRSRRHPDRSGNRAARHANGYSLIRPHPGRPSRAHGRRACSIACSRPRASTYTRCCRLLDDIKGMSPHHRRRPGRQPAAHVSAPTWRPSWTWMRGSARHCSAFCSRPATSPSWKCCAPSTLASALCCAFETSAQQPCWSALNAAGEQACAIGKNSAGPTGPAARGQLLASARGATLG